MPKPLSLESFMFGSFCRTGCGITLLPNDNRWITGEVQGCIFEFLLPNGLPARGYVSDAGYAELNVHVAVNPKTDLVMGSNISFADGEALAAGWLERERGAWLPEFNEQV